MKLSIRIDGSSYRLDPSNALPLSITLKPNGEQPNHFGAKDCISEVIRAEKFIGDTKQGGSCNVNQLTLIAHCNGTHTESISHIVNQLIPVHLAIPEAWFPCVVISIEPVLADSTSDDYVSGFEHQDRVIGRGQLEQCLSNYTNEQLTGLVLRTFPNTESKKSTVYNRENPPVFLTNSAMKYLLERNVQHLMVDFPSVDKMHDKGLLSNHRIFWNVEPGSNNLSDSSLINKTITEMIFVDHTISDGGYCCNLQVPAIETDAVPSNPLLFHLEKI